MATKEELGVERLLADLRTKPRPVTVADLIEDLQKLDPTRVVVMSKDSEGNGYKPMDSAMSGEGWFDPAEDQFYTDEDDIDPESESIVPAICLWPGSWPRKR